jgi:hypothetical protein
MFDGKKFFSVAKMILSVTSLIPPLKNSKFSSVWYRSIECPIMKGWPWPHLMVSDWSIVYRNDATGRGDRELLFLSGAREDLTVKEAHASPHTSAFQRTKNHIHRVKNAGHGQGMAKLQKCPVHVLLQCTGCFMAFAWVSSSKILRNRSA